ncbi:MAG: GUN4 domain-containing protein [Cyanobacteria bacterium P01_F01_bin.56]
MTSSTPQPGSPSPADSTSPAENASPSPELSAIQQMMGELTALRKEVGKLSMLPQQMQQLEQRLMVVGDLYRYETLHQQLINQEWFAADKETVKMIADIAGVTDLEDLSPREVRSLSCGELAVIDRLWTTYSNGHFGFSPQVQIYQQIGGTLDTTIGENVRLIERWGASLGWRDGASEQNPEGDRWRQCDELDFSLNAPQGCHPSRWWNSPYGSRMTNYFLNRLMTCEF